MNTKKLTTVAMLSAVALILFTVEAQIPLPLPIPGVKLGLSNVVTLFALWTLNRREASVVLLVRIVLGNFVVGTLSALIYSMAGGIVCFVTIALLKPLFSEKQIWLLSIFGALGHNTGQLLAAAWITGTPAVALVYAPVFYLLGIVTGFFTGQCAQAAIRHMKRIRSF